MVFDRIFRRISRSDAAGRTSGNKGTAKGGNSPSRRAVTRRLLMETLAKRELLASDLGAIAGTVYTDLSGDGLTGDDPRQAGVVVTLYQDGGDGTFDGGSGDDVLIGTDTSDASGNYRFDELGLGDYFVEQAAISGLISPSAPVAVSVVNDAGVTVQTIDTYDQTTQSVVANPGTPTDDDSTAAPEAIGGERDVLVNYTSGAGNVTLNVNAFGSGQLTFSSDSGVVGNTTVQYDGVDGSTVLAATGLGGVDLSASDSGAGLLLSTRGDTVGGTVQIRVYTDAVNFSTSDPIAIPSAASVQDIVVPFSDFTASGGSGADFTNVGAIEIEITGVADLDVDVSVVESLRPDIVAADLQNFQPLSLGGALWRDNNNDGLHDGSEPALVGVDVNLYRDTDGSGSLDTSIDELVDSTTTIAGGAYLFENLIPDDYLVQVPATEFMAGQPLFGFASSSGNDPAADPDDNVDDDDNGTAVTGLGVVSGVITLVSGAEPTDDGDADANTNLTVDFGFSPQVDVEIAKDVLTANPVAGGEATFRITVTNNGPLAATDVAVTDVIPAGLTFNRLENVPGTVTTSVAGNTVTADIGTMAVSASITFDIVVDIPASTVAGTLTNEATVAVSEEETDDSNNTDGADLTITRSTDLRITKSDDSDPVVAGETLVYTLTVVNDGPSDASGVSVTDTLPAGVTFVSGTMDGDATAVTESGGTVTATVGDLANGATTTILITVTVDADASAALSNTATVSNSPDTDPDATNNSTTEPTDVVREVDVQLTKTVTADAVAGETLTYTFVVANNGPSDANGVSVTDTLDDNLTFQSFDPLTSGVTQSLAGDVLTFDVGTLASGDSVTFTIDVLVDPGFSGQLSNTGAATTTDTDTVPANDTSTVVVTVDRQTDLAITKTASLATAIPGQSLTYTLTATNTGPSDASGVTIVDTLPANFTLTSVDAGSVPFTNASGVVTFNVGELAAGATTTVTLTGLVAASATQSIVNPAQITGNETETSTANNSASVTTPVTPQFDLSIEKSTTATAGIPGQQLSYTMVVTNAGPSTATSVQITDTLPAGVTFVSGAVGSTSATVSGNQVTYAVGTLAPGTSATATLTVMIGAGTTSSLVNTAVVSAASGETDTSDNTDTVTTPLTPTVDLSVTKTASASAPQIGDSLTYTIVVSNAGPSTATSVTATDTLPAGLTFVSGTSPSGGTVTANGQVVTVPVGSIAAGGTSTFTILTTVGAAASGTLTNTVAVATPLTESTTANNSASAAVTVDAATAQITGSVYVDANRNGVRDAGEEGIAGVTILLTGTDATGAAVSRSATTNATGDYVFSQLAAGTYRIEQEDQPAGLLDGEESAPSGADVTVGDDFFAAIGLSVGETQSGLNFGELNEPLSKRLFLAST